MQEDWVLISHRATDAAGYFGGPADIPIKDRAFRCSSPSGGFTVGIANRYRHRRVIMSGKTAFAVTLIILTGSWKPALFCRYPRVASRNFSLISAYEISFTGVINSFRGTILRKYS